MQKTKFIFDLDGTLTQLETLPLIAKHFGIEEKILNLTHETIKGNIPFVESFIRRTNILGECSANEIAALLDTIDLFEGVVEFIRANRDDCVIATGNLQQWIKKLADRIGCHYESSHGIFENDKLVKLTKILSKRSIVEAYQKEGFRVVFVGDGNNDAEAMRVADVAIASGLVHSPARSVVEVSDYAVYDERALLRLLEQIAHPPTQGISVVVSCAGIGSRLGLGCTKALIKLGDTTLIERLLTQFRTVDDLRIVVGYQASDVIGVVLKQRRDVTFVYNHDYFHTKTAASLYLGGRHANKFVLAWDGDLVSSGADVTRCLNSASEFLGFSKAISDDPVYAIVENGHVTGFTREGGDYEWTGPAYVDRDKLYFFEGDVCDQLKRYLPIRGLQLEAMDVDTHVDYRTVAEKLTEWGSKEASSVASS
jgi:HAD superfamily phosphoserine phosphatase-like hydrolase